jgi:DNA-binding transcriptional ArsR family regulator
MSTHTIRNLDQAKLLTDPFKLQLLERFSGKPITTKQVADAMGEKAPRLYRHVEALVTAGLLTLIEERPKRGTVERYYQTIASRFELDPELYASGDGEIDEIADMIRTVFRHTESDLLRLHRASATSLPDSIHPPLLLRFQIRGGFDQVSRLRQKLEDLVAECEAMADDDDDANESVAYSGLVTFYPKLERDDQ